MSTVAEIQEAIARLSSTERTELRLWLATYDEDAWDRQISADAASGKLNFLKRQAQSVRTSIKSSILLPYALP